jgi:hypothetical protein
VVGPADGRWAAASAKPPSSQSEKPAGSGSAIALTWATMLAELKNALAVP